MREDDAYQQALDRAFRFLSYRPRSRKELDDFFHKRYQGLNQEVADSVMSRLEELGHVNDREFAKWWVSARSGRHPKGVAKLTDELIRKGVSREVISQVIEDMRKGSEYCEYQAASRLAERKLRLWKTLPPEARTRRLYGMLKRRGFDTDTIRRIIDENNRNGYNMSQDNVPETDP